jgi:probable F420-dependent oxidoreductase
VGARPVELGSHGISRDEPNDAATLAKGVKVKVGVGIAVKSMTRELVDFVATTADELGYDSIWCGEHVAFGADHAAKYPYNVKADGQFPGPQDMDFAEPLGVLSYCAALTSRVRLGTNVLIPVHHPLYLAKQAATVDVLAQGRLIVGVGSGWQREEFDAMGVDFGRRGRLTDELIGALRAVWREDPSTYHGECFTFDAMRSFPKPFRGDIPIYIGGRGVNNIRRAIELGDGFSPGGTFDQVVAAWDEVKLGCERIGRDWSEIELLLHPDNSAWFGAWRELKDFANRAQDAGASCVIVPVTTFGVRDVRKTFERDAIREAMAAVANEVILKV